MNRYDMTTEYNKYACEDTVVPVQSESGEWIKFTDHVASLAAHQQQEKASAPVSEVADESHPDDIAVNNFAVAMKAKMAVSRMKGRGGWDDPEQCNVSDLCRMLVEHVEKGDPVDVGNFAMMLFNRGARSWELTTALAVYSTPAPADQSYPTLHDCEAVAKYAGREHPSGIGVKPVVEPETAGRESAAPVIQQPQDERASFEAWASDPVRASKLPLDRWPTNDAYVDHRTYTAFYGWQARAAAEAKLEAIRQGVEGLIGRPDNWIKRDEVLALHQPQPQADESGLPG